MIGTRLGPIEVTAKLGEGGMAGVGAADPSFGGRQRGVAGMCDK
jgi:hypothetical protein